MGVCCTSQNESKSHRNSNISNRDFFNDMMKNKDKEDTHRRIKSKFMIIMKLLRTRRLRIIKEE